MGTINVAGIIYESFVDGPGVRTTVFAQGCTRGCKGCHNPQTAKIGAGTDISVDEIIVEIKQNPMISGITFSGGEPFLQPKPFSELAKKLHACGYHVASYSGFTFEELLNGTPEQKELLCNIDVLIDGPFVLEKRSLSTPFRGSTNQRILDVPESCRQGTAVWKKSEAWGTAGI